MSTLLPAYVRRAPTVLNVDNVSFASTLNDRTVPTGGTGISSALARVARDLDARQAPLVVIRLARARSACENARCRAPGRPGAIGDSRMFASAPSRFADCDNRAGLIDA